MRTVPALLVTLLVPLGLLTTETPSDPTLPVELAPSPGEPTIEPAVELAAEVEHHVSLTPSVTVVGADVDQRALLDKVLSKFREYGLELPDIEVRYSDDEADCGGHLGLFQKQYTPWRLSVCTDFSFVPYHELAHAWEAVNVDDDARARYMEVRGLTNWNDREADWVERGVEDAARMIALNLMVNGAQLSLSIWDERLEAYELLVGRPSPVLALAGEESGGDHRADAERHVVVQPAGPG